MNAIIVDDEYYAQEGLKKKLTDAGVDVIGIYDNGTEFLKHFHLMKPDIIFMDIEMPKMTGLEVLAKLRVDKIQIPVVFVTAYIHYDAQAKVLNAFDYLLKPVTMERLQKVLANAKLIMNRNN